MRALVKPSALRAGATLAVLSPASTPKVELVYRGMERLRALGYKTVLSPHALDSGPLYYAGTLEQRLGSLQIGEHRLNSSHQHRSRMPSSA